MLFIFCFEVPFGCFYEGVKKKISKKYQKSLGKLKKASIFAPAIRNDGGIAQLVRAHDS